MNKILLVLILICIIVGINRCCASLNKKMYDDCMAAGDKSHDTCYTYSYLQ